MPILTIAIPTFDRNEILTKNLSFLIPQLTDDVALVIVDNNSLVPVMLDKPMQQLTVVRNKANIGGNANILRCFEVCETDWIWVLGDDDRVRPDAVKTILGIIALKPSVNFINFSTLNSFIRGLSINGAGCLDLLKKLDDFGNLLFISSSIFRTKALLRHLPYGYQFAYSCAPHLAMLLMSMEIENGFLLSSLSIVEWERPANENRGSLLVIARGLPALLELPLPSAHRHLLSKHLARFPRMSAVAHQLFLQCVYAGLSSSEARNELKRIIMRISWPSSPLRKVEGFIWKLLLLFPRLSYKILVRPLYYRATKHESGSHKMGLERL